MSNNKAIIYKKLSEIQNEISVPKERYNSYGNFFYRSAEDILNAAKPLLKQKGCVLLIEDNIEVIGKNNIYIKATAYLIDCESGEEISTHAYAKESKHNNLSDDQCTGTASSYARKYCLNALFLLDDNKDSDTDEMQRVTESNDEQPEIIEDMEETYPEFIQQSSPQPKPNWGKAKNNQSAQKSKQPNSEIKPNWEKSKQINASRNTTPN